MDGIENRLRDTNEVLLGELTACKRREDKQRMRAEAAECRIRDLEQAMTKILRKTKMDATAAVSMRAIAAEAIEKWVEDALARPRLSPCKWPNCECPRRGHNCMIDHSVQENLVPGKSG